MGVADLEPRASPGTRDEREAVVGPVRVDERELSFTLTLGEREHEVFFRSSLPPAPGAEPAAVASLLPAIATGRALRVRDPVGEATLDSMREAQAVLASWARSGAWLRAAPYANEVELRCQVAAPRPPLGGPVAAFFSGGVDSLSTVVRHPEISHLIHVAGFDTPLEAERLGAAVRERLAAAAAELGKELVTVDTNLRSMSDAYVLWPSYFGSALGAVALLLADHFSRVMIASGSRYGILYESGSHPLLDRLWGADRIEVVHDGAAQPRVAKLEQIAADPAAQRSLRVCWQSEDRSLNCGRCEKCVRTMVTLELLGARDRFPTLPGGELDLGAVAAIRLENRPEVDFWRENLELAVRERAAPELIAAIERCLASADPAPPGAPARRQEDPRLERPALWVRPETIDALAECRAIAFLVGGCDGWANFGDVAQLQATGELFAGLDPGLAALAVIDPRAEASWRALGLRAAGGFDPAHPVFFAQDVDGLGGLLDELGLLPLGAGRRVAATATWLYGGGYLNGRWGVRRLLAARATEALGERWGVGERGRLCTGLQIAPGWLRSLDPALRARLAALPELGVRDELSAEAALELTGDRERVTVTGDDAVGVLAAQRAAGSGAANGARLNLHFCPGDWVAPDPARTREYLERFAARLAPALGPALTVQPLLAYDEPGVLSERPALAELCAAIGARRPGTATAAPLVLRPDRLATAVATIGAAELTLCTSYHVALTSLLAGVPAVLVRGGLYYGQKADGLRRDFELPAELFPALDGEAEAAADAVAELLAGGRARLREALARGRARVAGRRAEVEARLRSRLASLLEAPAGGIPVAAAPLADYEAMAWGARRAHERSRALAAEAEWRRERLADIEGSASWRLTGPLRAAKARLRRRRRDASE